MAPNAPEEDWTAAVKHKDMAVLRQHIEDTKLSPETTKIQDAFVTACAGGLIEAMAILLDWGVPANSKDMSGRPALHAAAEAGAARAVELLCRRCVDTERLDPTGRSAMTVGLTRGQLPVVKELLRAGAAMPENASAPGLAAVIKEVQLEKHIEFLKDQAKASPEVTFGELQNADVGVWQCQREHMRLLRLREEQRAGKHLESFQQRTASELETAERYKLLEQEHQKSLAQRRAEVLAGKSCITSLVRELNDIASIEQQARAEDDKLKAELAVRQRDFDLLLADTEARRALHSSEQEAIDRAQARFARATDELAEQKQANLLVQMQLEEALRELKSWQADREAAARLTAQAQKLLGN